MIPAAYDINLSDTIYRTVEFYVDANQFDEPIPAYLEGWFEDEQDARDAALKLSVMTGQSVSIDVYGRWGWYGKELVDSFMVGG